MLTWACEESRPPGSARWCRARRRARGWTVHDGDLKGVADLVETIGDHDMVALVIGPHGGKLSDGTVRVRLMLEECYRHAKAIGVWGARAPTRWSRPASLTRLLAWFAATTPTAPSRSSSS